MACSYLFEPRVRSVSTELSCLSARQRREENGVAQGVEKHWPYRKGIGVRYRRLDRGDVDPRAGACREGLAFGDDGLTEGVHVRRFGGDRQQPPVGAPQNEQVFGEP